MEYPAWLIGMFTDNHCPECRGLLMLSNIDAIAAARPEHNIAHLRDPMALVIATCPHCNRQLHLSMRCPRELLMNAVKQFINQIESAPIGEPPLFGPGSKVVQQSDSGNRAGDDKSEPTIRPSLRAGQSLRPPTDAEVKTFLARLKRMSFKSGSKGFKKLSGNDRVDGDNDERRA
jgi:hypothetical protein